MFLFHLHGLDIMHQQKLKITKYEEDKMFFQKKINLLLY